MKKYWLGILSPAVILPVLMIACLPSNVAQATITLTCDDFQKQPNIVKDITLEVGNTLTVTLCSNKTTGFAWPEKAQINNAQAMEQTTHKWIPPDTSGKLGAPGNEVFTFKALQPGSSVISLGYSRPWEGGEKNVNTLKVNVKVK